MSRKTRLSLLISSIICTPLTAHAIQITDYWVPKSEYQQAFLLGKFNSKTGNQDTTSYNLTLEGNYDYNLTSLPRNWRVLLDGIANVSHGPNDEDKTDKNIIANAHANVDNYFKEGEKLFWFGSADLGYLDDADDQFAKIGAGIGYGRVINATPLAKTLRVEEELREHGVVIGQMKDADYLAIARVIDRESEFRSRYGAEEYKSYWFGEIESRLKAAGVLKNGQLGASGAIHMDRVLDAESISVRKHGWVVRGGVGLVVQDFNGNKGDPSLDFEWEYAIPNGYKGQFINTLNYSTVLADHTDQTFRNTMTYTHEIGDRIDWENKWRAVFQVSGGNANDILTNIVSSTFRYYLTNRINLDATVAITNVEDDIDGNNNDDTDVTTFLGVRYRLK